MPSVVEDEWREAQAAALEPAGRDNWARPCPPLQIWAERSAWRRRAALDLSNPRCRGLSKWSKEVFLIMRIIDYF